MVEVRAMVNVGVRIGLRGCFRVGVRVRVSVMVRGRFKPITLKFKVIVSM